MADASATLYNTDFRAAIARNKRNTVILFVVLLLISAIVGYVLGWAIAILELIWNVPPAELSQLSAGAVLLDLFGPPRPSALLGAAIVTGAGLIWGLITLSSGAEILASFAGARDANPNDPLERQFINVVAEMAIAAGLGPPRAMVIDTPALNAFASGSSPKHAMVTATTGILQACTREEIQAVIGHEMGHVAEYDVRYTTVVAAMAGVIVLLAHFLGNIAQYSFGWGGYGYGGYGYRSRSRDEGGAGGIRIALTLVVVVVLVVLLIVAPLASKLVQMAISRQREYLADVSSAKLTRNPVGLIHALQRLEASDTNVAPSNSPVSALCIAAPKGAWFSGLFSTHPPIPDRIARLRNLGGAAVSDTDPLPPLPPRAVAQDVPPAEPHRHGPWDTDEPRRNGPWDTDQPPPSPPPQKGPWG
jgi:heat shock protein HtpX